MSASTPAPPPTALPMPASPATAVFDSAVQHAKLDVALVLGAGSCVAGACWSAPWSIGLATAIVLVGLALRGARLAALLGAFAFLIGGVRAAGQITAYEHERGEIVARGRWPSRCAVHGVVGRSPVSIGAAAKVDVEPTAVECEGVPTPLTKAITLHVPDGVGPPLARGDVVDVIAQLAPTHRFWNEETGDPRPAQARRRVVLSGGADDVVVTQRGRGWRAAIDRIRDRLRRRILATFPADTQPMARALVLGEEDLSSADQKAFRRSGLAHLLAVSGMHLVLVVSTMVGLVRLVLARLPCIATRVAPIRIAAALGVPLAWTYAEIAGGSGSAMRAAWMMSIAFMAHVLSRRPDPWRAFGLSVVGLVAFDPLAIWDLSFVLSAAATGGLLLLASRIAAVALAWAPAWSAPGVRAVSASIAASVACAPVLACMTADLPVAGVLANLVAVPLGEMAALPLCLVHCLLEPFPSAEQGAAIAASGALALVRRIAHGFAALPWASASVPTPSGAQLAALGALAFGANRAVTKHPRLFALGCLALVGALEWEIRARAAPKGVVRATFLDVGQGDSAIIDLPDGTAFVIDGGGLVGSPVDTGERVLAPMLRARRRDELAFAVLSHPHPDHFGGLVQGLAGTKIGALWDSGQGEVEGVAGGYASLLADMRGRGTKVLRPADLCGTHIIGGATIDVLAPCPSLAMDRGANDNSLVVRVRFGARAFLFVGDAEHLEEHELLTTPAALRADVLKVGHHGSRTSTTPAFVAAVQPEIAVVSCGIRNRFGHPAPKTLATLADVGARVHRIDLDGSVTITTDGRTLDVRSAADAR